MYHQHIELPPRPSIHFIERLHRIGRQAYGDRPIADEVPWINWPDDVHQEADRIWHSLVGESSPGQAVLVNMSAGIPRRTWPDEKYRELMPRLLEEYGDKVARWVVTAAPHEHHRATELVTFCNHPNLIALPEIPDFRVVAALVARFLLVITPDTSIVHACSAHGTPVVMFTVAENVIAWAPWGVEHGMVACEKTEWTESIPVDDLIAAICQTSASDTTTSA